MVEVVTVPVRTVQVRWLPDAACSVTTLLSLWGADRRYSVSPKNSEPSARIHLGMTLPGFLVEAVSS